MVNHGGLFTGVERRPASFHHGSEFDHASRMALQISRSSAPSERVPGDSGAGTRPEEDGSTVAGRSDAHDGSHPRCGQQAGAHARPRDRDPRAHAQRPARPRGSAPQQARLIADPLPDGAPDLSIHPMLYNGGAEALCAAVLVVLAIVGIGLIALFHMAFPSPSEAFGAVGCVEGLVLGMRSGCVSRRAVGRSIVVAT